MTEYASTVTTVKFHDSEAFVRGLMGPIGSGKSVACCMELIFKAAAQRPNEEGVRKTRFAVIRNTYRELLDTTLNTWHDWFPREMGLWSAQDMKQTIIQQLDDGTTMHCEILFRALDRPQDVKKLLSLELTGAWVNEAREIPKAVVDMLQGRVGRYPSQRDSGPSWWGIIMDTNPPDEDHWWYILFEEKRPDDWALFRQPGGMTEQAENRENLPPKYYERMMGGKTDEWIKVYVHGEYGFVTSGKPVHPKYVDSVHCLHRDFTPALDKDIILGFDFGRTPACAMLQQTSFGGWVCFDEFCAIDMSAASFAPELKRYLGQHYPGYNFRGWGDPSGDNKGQANDDTPIRVLKAHGINCRPTQTNDPLIRRAAVETPLSELDMNGHPRLVILPKAKIIRKGLSGGFSYKRLQVAGDERYHDEPDKNMYSHPVEALEYALQGEGEGKKLFVPRQNDNSYNNWDTPINY